ncbi:MAG: hypothetical protein IT384_15430 [Deltaproteobacteria bacterium]|nr:hypothetical protein [Deltaproteobacteria bacterium]
MSHPISFPIHTFHQSPAPLGAKRPIGELKTLQARAPEIIQSLGADFPVGELRQIFGGLNVSQIASLPASQRHQFIDHFLTEVGLGNAAGKGSILSALYGRLGARVMSGSDYYVQIGGAQYDREILQGFIRSVAGPKDHLVSAKDARLFIVPPMVDGQGLTPTEASTYLFGLRHFKATDKAVREELVVALRKATGMPVKALGEGKQGFDFGELYDHLDKNGRLADLYSAKTDMKPEEMMQMWDHGITLEQLNDHLKASYEPKSLAALTKDFGAEAIAEVRTWLAQQKDTKTLKRLASGQVSAGELQNLIYGSWQMANTPYDPSLKPVYVPIPVTAAKAPTLDGFLGDVEGAVAKHDWSTLLSYFDPANRETQKSIGVESDAQYLAEGLGLHTVGNSLPGDITSFDTLAQISSVSFERVPTAAGEIKGTATLKGGQTLEASLFVGEKGKGFQVTPAVG